MIKQSIVAIAVAIVMTISLTGCQRDNPQPVVGTLEPPTIEEVQTDPMEGWVLWTEYKQNSSVFLIFRKCDGTTLNYVSVSKTASTTYSPSGWAVANSEQCPPQ